MFPAVEVDPGVLYIDGGDVLTSAGVAAGLDLCLHVVRTDHGAAVATEIARHSVVAPHREGGQAQFINQPVLTSDPEISVAPTMAWASDHLDERLNLRQMASVARMSVRTLSRRFREETGTTPLQWLLSQRVSRAQLLMETTGRPSTPSHIGPGSPTHPHCAVISSVEWARRPVRTGRRFGTVRPTGAATAWLL
jgi:transcriptional regulator GlxA family with amidase domain